MGCIFYHTVRVNNYLNIGLSVDLLKLLWHQA